MVRCLLTLLVLIFSFVSPTLAATFSVNSTADEVDAAPGNGVCASGSGKCTLRAAIMEANATVAGDTINVPDGVYMLNLFGSGEDAAATGDLDITNPLTIAGASKSGTIFDGVGADRILDVTVAGSLSLSNATLRNGSIAGNEGGGIRSKSTTLLTVSNVLFTSNFADVGAGVFHERALSVADREFLSNSASTGAGIFRSGTGPVTVSGSTFADNLAADFGGLFVSTDSLTSIQNSVFRSNLATNAPGVYVVDLATSGLQVDGSQFEDLVSPSLGAIFYDGDGPVFISNSAFTRCQGSGSGAMYIVGNDAGLSVDKTTFTDNRSMSVGGDIFFSSVNGNFAFTNSSSSGAVVDNGAGGSVYAASGAGSAVVQDKYFFFGFILKGAGGAFFLSGFVNATLERVSVTNNSLFTGSGAGLYVAVSGTFSLIDSTIAGNTLSSGAGAGSFSTSTSTVVRRSSFYDNRVTATGGVGGGMYDSSGSLVVENSTFHNNAGSDSGGALFGSTTGQITNSTFTSNSSLVNGSAIFASGLFTIANTVIAGESSVDACFPSLNFTSSGWNLEEGSSCNLTGTGDVSNTAPLLSSLGDFGGPTMTQVPLLGSPLIDTGSNVFCLATDQRGDNRPFDGDQDGAATCDIGAAEFNDFCPDDAAKTFPGVCGCGVADTDTDGDGTFDCNDQCASDPGKTAPGGCGCGIADSDLNANGIFDCFSNDELKSYLDVLSVDLAQMKQIKDSTKKNKKKKIKAAKKAFKATLEELVGFSPNVAGASLIVADVTVTELTGDLEKKGKKALKVKNKKFKRFKKRAQKAIDAFLSALGY